MSHEHIIDNVADAKKFILAGNAKFTLRSKATGMRYTYKVRQAKGKPVHYLHVLTGQDNETAYTYVGTLLSDGRFSHHPASFIKPDAPSVKAWTWFWRHLSANDLPNTVECWHEGRCGRCGRTLTVPESLAAGLGPECLNYAMVKTLPTKADWMYA